MSRETEFACLITPEIAYDRAALANIKHRYFGNGPKYYFREKSEDESKNNNRTCSQGWGCIADADPRLEYMMMTASKFLPSGWTVHNTGCVYADGDGAGADATSPVYLRASGSTKNHFAGLAIDIAIKTADGTTLSNIRNYRSFRTYELFAQIIGKLIHENLVTDEQGIPVDWRDLIVNKQGPNGEAPLPAGHHGARRQFDADGKEFWSFNDNGKLIKHQSGLGQEEGDYLFTPRNAPTTGLGFRWGGYFGTGKYYLRSEKTTTEQLRKPNNDGKFEGEIVEWNPGKKIFEKHKIPLVDEEGVQVVVWRPDKFDKKGKLIEAAHWEKQYWDEVDNIGWDSMHFDFRPIGGGWNPGGLDSRSRELLTIPVGLGNPTGEPIPPRSVGLSKTGVQNLRLPLTPEESYHRFNETLGIPIPKDFVGVAPPPVMLNNRISELEYNAREAEIEASQMTPYTGYSDPDSQPVTVPIVTTSTKSKTSQPRERAPSGPYRER